MRVAIVGAGAAGLASARHVQASQRHSCVVFERATQVGGTWVYTDEMGVASDGLPVHTSMYQNLRTNLPKEVMGFPDFPIPQREESYLPAKDILQFLNDYADHFGLRKHIKPVRWGDESCRIRLTRMWWNGEVRVLSQGRPRLRWGDDTIPVLPPVKPRMWWNNGVTITRKLQPLSSADSCRPPGSEASKSESYYRSSYVEQW